MERFVFFKRWGSLLSVRTALPVANYGRTHQINLIPPPLQHPRGCELWLEHMQLSLGVEVGEALGLKRARGGGGGWWDVCVCVCVYVQEVAA